MGKKKRSQPNVEDILARPWCYYCERDFEDLKLLTSHQKAKHFKCDRCGRRLNTAGGLSVHMNQVHKEALEHVENALPNRQGLEVEIFGMEGIPEDILEQHRNRIIQNFYQAREDRRIATGNPLPGQNFQNARSKIKYETTEELLARFAEWRIKRENIPVGGGAMEGVVPTNPSPGSFNQPHQVPPQGLDQNYAAQGYSAQQPYGYPADGLPARPTSGANLGGLPPRPDGLPAGQGDDIDQLIRMAEAGIRPGKAEGEDGEKKSKKDKKGKMVYDDAEFSPEERMAQFARYAFRPEATAA
ncbi:hypothetical protein CC79DRAFT_1363760 [Sarocladium strictum]